MAPPCKFWTIRAFLKSPASQNIDLSCAGRNPVFGRQAKQFGHYFKTGWTAIVQPSLSYCLHENKKWD